MGSQEYRFRILGDVRGKRVLDVGCGLGDNAILLASFGARVTGVDVSRGSLEAARRRAFDVIWGDGVLHHLLHDLDGAMTRLARAAREGRSSSSPSRSIACPGCDASAWRCRSR
jgi:SAM-dependent methyltransferase